MGKKKAKDNLKQKDKSKQKAKPDKVSRQELNDEIGRLRQLSEQLQARLERIAEIASSTIDSGESDGIKPGKSN